MKRLIAVIALAFGTTLFCGTAATAYVSGVDDITPTDAYNWSVSDPNVYILDVRSEPEWRWVGHPGKNKLGEGAALGGKVVNIAYQIDYKGGWVVNPSFVSDVTGLFAANPDVVLITMCRSGARSIAALDALKAAGFMNVYNMVQGFEGGTDPKGYRTVNGWKKSLPYTTSGAGYQD